MQIILQWPHPSAVLLPTVSVACSQPLSENIKQKFIILEVYVFLNNVMKSHAILFCAVWNVNHPFVQSSTHTISNLSVVD
jgi:hypothetical protein